MSPLRGLGGFTYLLFISAAFLVHFVLSMQMKMCLVLFVSIPMPYCIGTVWASIFSALLDKIGFVLFSNFSLFFIKSSISCFRVSPLSLHHSPSRPTMNEESHSHDSVNHGKLYTENKNMDEHF